MYCRKYAYRFCLCWLIMALMACEEVVEPSLITTAPILIIEGRVSDRPNETFVRLTTTTSFNDPEPNPSVSNARVQMRGNAGSLMAFFEQTPGRYVPSESDFIGKQGENYSLFIRVGTSFYVGTAKMPPKPTIDSLTFAFEPRNIDQEAGYYVSYHYQDPATKDFHLLRFWNNGEEAVREKFEIRNDVNVNGKYLRFKIPKAFEASDTVVVQIATLTELSYKYFEGLNLLVESGSPSQAVPENPATNISGENTPVLGIFYATASATDTIIIQP